MAVNNTSSNPYKYGNQFLKIPSYQIIPILNTHFYVKLKSTFSLVESSAEIVTS